MSSFTKLSALAFASSVLAKPFPQAYNYGGVSSSPAPYAYAPVNSTSVYSAPASSDTCTDSLSSTVYASPTAPAYSSSSAPVYSSSSAPVYSSSSISSSPVIPYNSTTCTEEESSATTPATYATESKPTYPVNSPVTYSTESKPATYPAPTPGTYSSPSSPVYSTPSVPAYSSPSAPGYSSSSAPVYSSPSSPVYSSASPPVYSSASVPAYSSPSAPAYSAPSSSQGYVTSTSTQYYTHTKTVLQAPSSSGVTVSAGGYSSGNAGTCGPQYTVTETAKVYVTVTAGYQAPSSPVQSYSSSSHSASSAPVYSSHSAPVYSSSSAPAYSAPSSSAPVYSAPSSSSTPSAPAYTAPAAYTAPVKVAESASSTASAPATYSSSSGSSSGGKRGLAYNSASLLSCFEDSKEITWAYNWVSASAGLPSNFNYVPELHDGSVTFTSVWAVEAAAAIATGSKTLFSFNEPDMVSQANMSPEDAAQVYKDNMNPFAGKANLCAPAVTNGVGTNLGLDWLQNFITACNGECQIDCYNIHYYNPTIDVQGFKDQVSAAMKIAGDKPLWVGEFGVDGASDDEVTGFLEEVMPWMDGIDQIAGYAYFMAADGQLISGSEPSSYGSTYMSYTS